MPERIRKVRKDFGFMSKASFSVEVNNTSRSSYEGKFVVARLVNGELWYYGAYETEEDAERVRDVFENGVVLKGE